MVESIEELRKICQPRKQIIWYFNIVRKISIYITRLLLNLNITANQVTLSNMLLLLIGGSLLSFGNYWYSIIGTLILNLHCILDKVDGELAYYESHKCTRTKWASFLGPFLEKISHSILVPFTFICISFGVYNNLQDVSVFILSFLMSLSLMLYWFSDVLFQRFNENAYAQALMQNHSGITRILSKMYDHKIVVEIRRNLFVSSTIFLATLVMAALNCLYVVLVFYGTTLPLFVVISVYIKLSSLKDETG